MELHLPITAEFQNSDLAPEDLDAQIHATEVKS